MREGLNRLLLDEIQTTGGVGYARRRVTVANGVRRRSSFAGDGRSAEFDPDVICAGGARCKSGSHRACSRIY